MCKENLGIEGLIITSDGSNIGELNHLEVKISPIVKVENGKEKTEKYIGQVNFVTDKEVELPEKFNIKGTVIDEKETIYIKDCTECIKIGDNKYQAKC